MMSRLAAASVLLLLLSSCGLPGNVVVLIPDENGHVGRAVVSANGQTVELDRASNASEIDPGRAPKKIAAATLAQINKEFAATLAATPRQPRIFRVYFANGSADLDAQAHATLNQAIAAVKATPAADVGVAGYTDAVGRSDAANAPLSQRRADAVSKVLIANGFPPGMIEITFLGSQNPAVPNRPGVPEPLNRRVEITIR